MVWKFQSHDLYEDGNVESNHGHESPLFDVFIEVLAVSACKEDSSELTYAILQDPSVSSCCKVGLIHRATNGYKKTLSAEKSHSSDADSPQVWVDWEFQIAISYRIWITIREKSLEERVVHIALDLALRHPVKLSKLVYFLGLLVNLNRLWLFVFLVLVRVDHNELVFLWLLLFAVLLLVFFLFLLSFYVLFLTLASVGFNWVLVRKVLREASSLRRVAPMFLKESEASMGVMLLACLDWAGKKASVELKGGEFGKWATSHV